MFCPNCGKQTEGVYCRYCGARLDGAGEVFSDVDFVPEDGGFVPEKSVFGPEGGAGDETMVLEPLDVYAPEAGPRRAVGAGADSEGVTGARMENRPRPSGGRETGNRLVRTENRQVYNETGSPDSAEEKKKLGAKLQDALSSHGNLGRDPYEAVDQEEPWPEDDPVYEERSKRGKKKAGGAAGRLLPALLRLASIALMAVILFSLGREIWIARAVLGSISSVVSEKNWAEAVYLVLSVLTLAYGLLSMFWMTRRRKRFYDGKLRKFDTGRGLSSFILFALLAFAAARTALLIPYRPGVLTGISQYLLVVASVQYVVYGCSVLGIACCIVRKKMKY